MTITNDSKQLHVAADRSQAVWAAIAAGLMLFFSFGQGYKGLVLATQVFEYTLKVGGIAMAVSAVLLFAGRPFALLFDGVACILIGGGLALSGLLMFVEMRGVAFQGLLNLVFGYMFVGSGRQSLTLWKNLLKIRVNVGDAEKSSTVGQWDQRRSFAKPACDESSSAPPSSLTGELLARRLDGDFDLPSVPDGDKHAMPEDENSKPADMPEGFLASFADPPDEEKPAQ